MRHAVKRSAGPDARKRSVRRPGTLAGLKPDPSGPTQFGHEAVNAEIGERKRVAKTPGIHRLVLAANDKTVQIDPAGQVILVVPRFTGVDPTCLAIIPYGKNSAHLG